MKNTVTKVAAENGYYAEYEDGSLSFYDNEDNHIADWDTRDCLLSNCSLSQQNVRHLPELFDKISNEAPELWGHS